MSELTYTNLGFVHVATQRTGYVYDGPWSNFDKSGERDPDGRWPIVSNSTFYAVKWDDTGEEGDAFEHEIEWIPLNRRHITDGKRVCHCGPSTIDGIVVHRGTEELS